MNLPAFYRQQAQLMWEWRATRLSLIRRGLLTVVASALAMLIIEHVSADLSISGPAPLIVAAVLLTLLNSVVRPLLLLGLSPLPAFTVPIAGLLIEVPIVVLIGQVVPGVQVGSLDAAVRDAIMLTILNALFAEILRASDDDSYHGTQVRRLAAREFGRPGPAEPGLLMVQLDGLSKPVLEEQLRSGRMPVLDRLIRSGDSIIDPWAAMLPPVTPVSQAGILHGDNDDMPGFRWFDKATGTLLVANTPDGASTIVQQRSNGKGLLADDGASIGNLVTGDAARTYLTMATIAEDLPSADDPTIRGIFVSQVNYIRLAVLTLGEVAKELYQRERQRGRDVRPRIHRDLHYAFERALTNVSLRNITTALVIEEMFGSAPAIYVDYTGYDALAHHVGPERVEALDALDGLDRTVGSLLRAARNAPRTYRLVVLSDHGQSLGEPFSQKFGELLEDVVRTIIELPLSASGSRLRDVEHGGTGRMILGELGRGRGVRPVIARRAARRRSAIQAADQEAVVVCPSGNLALLYFSFTPDRAGLEDIAREYPDLIARLVAHPGVELVLGHSAAHGPVVFGKRGERRLATDEVTGEDPLSPFGPHAADGLRRLDEFANVGDLVLIGPYDPATGEVVSYEDLVGSHGGLGGWQEQPFLLHPRDLVVEEPLIGAVMVHQQLRRWLDALTRADVAADQDRAGAAVLPSDADAASLAPAPDSTLEEPAAAAAS